MGQFTKIKLFTLAQVFVTVGVVYSISLNADQIAPDERVVRCGNKFPNMDSKYFDCLKQSGIGAVNDDSTKTCQSDFASYNSKRGEVSNACSKMGNPGSDGDTCSAQVNDCISKASDNSTDITSSTMEQIAGASGFGSIDNMSKKCPSMSYHDWKSDHDKVDRTLRDDQTKLTDLAKKRSQEQKDLNSKQEDLMTQFNDLNSKYQQDQLKAGKEKRDAAAAQQKALADAKKGLYDAQNQLLLVQNDLTQQMILKSQKELELSSAIPLAQMKCKADYQEYLKKNPTANSGYGNVTNLVGGGSGSRNSVQTSYSVCISNFLKGKQSEVQGISAKIQVAQNTVNQAQEGIKAGQDALVTAQNNIAADAADALKGDQLAQQKYNADVASVQSKMNNAWTAAQQDQNNINQEQSIINGQISQDNKDLISMESEKPTSGATGTYDDVTAKWYAAKLALDQAKISCKCDIDTTNKATCDKLAKDDKGAIGQAPGGAEDGAF